ncbi:hypothetical protein LPJ78_003703 [Coemansia sp. RSA 989]|nr:hypothetical protein BX667DRAFT_509459 [Coemansia mojavensis]KAJ1863966.1 hypothetical protein LPJ78_003703 [Coemansia sp. RSA 989]KAJ1871692.1 hypothetical protein LPJ55_003700 [Coemansia sp. RSA 990]
MSQPPSQDQAQPQTQQPQLHPATRLQRSILPNREILDREEGSIYAEMIERKREKNKLAARRKRERKKQRLEELEERKVKLEQRRLTLHAELRARRRMNRIMARQLQAGSTVGRAPHFTSSESSDQGFSAGSFSDDNAASDSHKSGREQAAGCSKPYAAQKPSHAREGDSLLSVELDQLRDEVEAACKQTLGALEMLNEIRSDISSLLEKTSNAENS